jgi:protein-tyrosine phosphatase
MKTILFLCTGNYYRSRYSEIFFNWYSGLQAKGWVSVSRGLDLSKGSNNIGPISAQALERIKMRSLPLDSTGRFPVQTTFDDLKMAEKVICLLESEHRPYIESLFPDWVNKVYYWDIKDVPPTGMYDPLKEIEKKVTVLVDSLQ